MQSDRRLPGWPERLARCIEAARRRRFQWGEHDCCLWTATVVQILTGCDIGKSFRGTYGTSEEASERIRRDGVEGIGALLSSIASQWGFPEIAPPLAQRGDVVLCDTAGRAGWPVSCGVCVGSVVLSTGREGLMALPLSSGLRAWSI